MGSSSLCDASADHASHTVRAQSMLNVIPQPPSKVSEGVSRGSHQCG